MLGRIVDRVGAFSLYSRWPPSRRLGEHFGQRQARSDDPRREVMQGLFSLVRRDIIEHTLEAPIVFRLVNRYECVGSAWFEYLDGSDVWRCEHSSVREHSKRQRY